MRPIVSVTDTCRNCGTTDRRSHLMIRSSIAEHNRDPAFSAARVCFDRRRPGKSAAAADRAREPSTYKAAKVRWRSFRLCHAGNERERHLSSEPARRTACSSVLSILAGPQSTGEPWEVPSILVTVLTKTESIVLIEAAGPRGCLRLIKFSRRFKAKFPRRASP